MNTRTAARELAFLAIGQVSKNTELNSEELILAATRMLSDLCRSKAKKVRKDLKKLGDYFFNKDLDQNTNEEELPINLKELHQHVAELEVASYIVQEAAELPELLNHKEEAFTYAGELVEHFRQNKEKINTLLDTTLQQRRAQTGEKGWSIDRIVSTDRTCLKIAITELLMSKNIPPQVIIDEAMSLSSKYGSDESAKFLNGVLADIVKEI